MRGADEVPAEAQAADAASRREEATKQMRRYRRSAT